VDARSVIDQNCPMQEVTDPKVAALLDKIEPGEVRRSLVRAGLFIAGYELLKGEIVDRVRQFFVQGFDEEGPTRDPSYETKVRALHKKEFEACLLWLAQCDALNHQQVQAVKAVRAHRNEMAHELPRFIVDVTAVVDVALLREMRDVIASLGRFWGAIEVSIDPDFDGVDVDSSESKSGVQLLMDHLISAAELV
jgi:hypothetical protein